MAKLIYFTSLLLFLVVSSYGQTTVGAFGEVIKKQSPAISEVSTISKENINQGASNTADKKKGIKVKEVKTKNADKYRYMSYKIQVTKTDSPLDLSHHIFTLCKNVTFNQTRNDGFIYFQGDYSDEEQAKIILEKIQRIFPQATIVKERRYLKTDEQP